MATEKLKFELYLEEVNMILSGLNELPAKVSINLINKIQESGNRQLERLKAKNTQFVPRNGFRTPPKPPKKKSK
jgi:hypothetical protein